VPRSISQKLPRLDEIRDTHECETSCVSSSHGRAQGRGGAGCDDQPGTFPYRPGLLRAVDAGRTRSASLINGGVERGGGRRDVVLPLLFCALVVGDDVVSRDELMRGRSSIRPTGGTSRTEHHIPRTPCDLKPLSRDQVEREA
jgi:hypothetical protein